MYIFKQLEKRIDVYGEIADIKKAKMHSTIYKLKRIIRNSKNDSLQQYFLLNMLQT